MPTHDNQPQQPTLPPFTSTAIKYWLNTHEGDGYEVFDTRDERDDRAHGLLAGVRSRVERGGEWGDVDSWEAGTLVVTHRVVQDPQDANGEGAVEYRWQRQFERQDSDEPNAEMIVVPASMLRGGK